jgi:outer membrane protein assembly factor BamB
MTKPVLFFSLLICLSCRSEAQNQDGWLGPDRTGIYSQSGLLKVWPDGGPRLLWETTDIGPGFSSVTASEDAVYVTGRIGENDVLTSFSHEGRKKWEVEYGKASKSSSYPDSRGTATLSGNKLFLVSGTGDAVCINTQGKIIWSVNYYEKYSGVVPDFGISENPLVIGNKVILTPGGKKAAMVALSAENGNVIWETASIDDVTQYVNPILIEFRGKKLIVTHSAKYIIAVDLNSGKLQWKFDYMAQSTTTEWRFAHINTPVYRDGFLFVSSGYDKPALKLRLSADDATSSPTLVWKNNDLDPHIGGALLIGDYLFGSNWETSSYGKWVCVDWNTGKTLWINAWYNKGSLIAADGLLYLFEEKNGHVGLVKPGPEKMEVISEFRVTGGTGPYWAYPVINNGRLYLRHGSYLAVYSIK